MKNENLFDLIEPLESSRREDLVKFCLNMGLSESACEGIEQSARLLREFELYEKKQTPTSKEQLENLNNIADLSKKLQHAIASTTTIGKIYLHGRMEEKPLNSGMFWPEVVPLSGIPGYLQIALNCMELAALEGAEYFSSRLQKSGRKSVLGSYFAHIEWVWYSVKSEGIPLGRNGKFEKICNAVFQAAGVPASAEGAVRYFVENRPRIESDRASWPDDFAE
jgi:hypothetical protein